MHIIEQENCETTYYDVHYISNQNQHKEVVRCICTLGYEPAGLTMHPPPQNDRGWVHFFRIIY